ncbi:MAG: YbaK/EbsC family protein [Planctomycetales bacterium]|nr:YbaK/EbsC family protein [Planctomycetales bacterium]
MNVAKYLTEQSIDYDVITHRDAYDAQRLAAAIHVSGKEVAKTVLLRTDSGQYVVAVVPANLTINLLEVADMLHETGVGLASEREIVKQCPDCERGVLPPFGSQYGMETIVDESLTEDFEIVFEGNTHHEAIRMRMDDYRRMEQPRIGNFTHKSYF